MDRFDLLIIGGGINGTAIARDAAGRGLKVLLVEKDDLASHTSSASSKLIHGGLRYLEQYEFGLVRESLHERETMLRTAPHLVRPLEFILPDPPGGRPWWMIRAGLLLYDLLAAGAAACRARAGVKRSDPRARGAEAGPQARFLLGRLGRRCPAGRAERGRRGGARRGDRHPDRVAFGPPRRRCLDRRAGRRPDGARRDDRQRRRPLGVRRAQRAAGDRGGEPCPADQGQPYRRAAPLRGRACLHPAAAGRPGRLRASLWRAQSGRHHRHRRRRRPRMR